MHIPLPVLSQSSRPPTFLKNALQYLVTTLAIYISSPPTAIQKKLIYFTRINYTNESTSKDLRINNKGKCIIELSIVSLPRQFALVGGGGEVGSR